MTDELRADDRPTAAAAAAICEAFDERRHGFGRPLADAAAEFRRRNGLVLGARSHAAAAFRVVVLPRADRDLQSLYDDRLDADPAAAFRWANAFLLALHRLEADPESFGLAPEAAEVSEPIRQILFEGRVGPACRTLFTVAESRVDVLAVRGSTDAGRGGEESRRIAVRAGTAFVSEPRAVRCFSIIPPNAFKTGSARSG